MASTAMITGISGQDGWYLSQLLLDHGYEVHGLCRSTSMASARMKLDPRIVLHAVKDEHPGSYTKLIAELEPDELYHLAADSFVPNSWQAPAKNASINYGLTIEILEAIRIYSPNTRMLNACSREIFGNHFSGSADEETRMSPSTPYGINKAAGRWMIAAYRDQYDLFLSNAILFNHESPHRGENFVTRKISKRVAEIANGTARRLQLGNLSIRRDWGFAGDFVEAMWRSLQIDEGHDFVLGTGVTHSIQDFAELAFQCVDLDWQCYVETRPELARHGEGGTISANPSKAEQMLDWHPSVSFVDLVEMMVAADRRSLSVEKSRQAA